MEIPFRAVVADILYGEHRKLKEDLENTGIPYVLAIKPSYAWYRPVGEPGTVEEVAYLAPWDSPEDPGEWVRLERTFWDGRTEQWWALEAECRPFGPEKRRRLVVAPTDPAELPELTTWYLVTNLPLPGSSRAAQSDFTPADVAEITSLYALRSWIEQSYKQVKNSLGWAHYQVRKDVSIRRHWQLVCCAFTFWWWTCAAFLEGKTLPGVVLDTEETSSASAPEAERGKKEGQTPVSYVLARGVEEGEGVAGAVRNAMAILESVLRQAPAQRAKSAA